MKTNASLFEGAADYTRALLTYHYERKSQLFYDALDERVMWIGPLEHQFVVGRDKVIEILNAEQDVVFHMTDSAFHLIYTDVHSCVVTGWIAVCTEEDSGYVLKCRQRITFTYRMAVGRLLVTHMHVSESWDVLKEDEIFPFRLAKQTYQYMQQLLQMKMGNYEKLMVYDSRKRAHFIMENEIIYVEACNIHCYLYCLDGKFLIMESIGGIVKKLSERFIRVHRSYIINVDYVIGMKRFFIQLCDGIKVPVPEKKYVWVREEIGKRMSLMGREGTARLGGRQAGGGN